jgi:hypothetical protein
MTLLNCGRCSLGAAVMSAMELAAHLVIKLIASEFFPKGSRHVDCARSNICRHLHLPSHFFRILEWSKRMSRHSGNALPLVSGRKQTTIRDTRKSKLRVVTDLAGPPRTVNSHAA